MIKQGSKLLLDEQPLVVLPQLAKLIGLNEAIIVQQIHYWNEINKKNNNNFRDGYHWTFNSYQQWIEQFPFWSEKTIKRTITGLENIGIIVSGNYNKMKIDRTKWYRIDEKMLEKLCKTPKGQNDPIIRSSCPDHKVKLSPPIPETNSKINSKNNINASSPTNDGCGYVDNFTEDGQIVYDYFIGKYFLTMGSQHPSVNQSTVNSINKIMEDEYITDPEFDNELSIDINAMIDMIDWYFDSNNPLYGDRRIYHFLSPMILKNLYNKVAR
jgi:hypothetical protein